MRLPESGKFSLGTTLSSFSYTKTHEGDTCQYRFVCDEPITFDGSQWIEVDETTKIPYLCMTEGDQSQPIAGTWDVPQMVMAV